MNCFSRDIDSHCRVLSAAVIAGANIRSVPLAPGIDFFGELECAIRGSYPKPKMMVLGFPSNPTPQCVELDFFERVIALARKHDLFVVHDLAYADSQAMRGIKAMLRADGVSHPAGA